MNKIGGMMRKAILILMVSTVLILGACSQQQGNNDGNNADEGSTVTEVLLTPTPTLTPTPELPATFTPVAVNHNEHIFVVSGGGAFGGGDRPPISVTQAIHVVQRGEYLSAIANRYGVTVKMLVDANGIKNANHIEVGDVIYVPPAE
jgi:nucleoid-associated protein YgaU